MSIPRLLTFTWRPRTCAPPMTRPGTGSAPGRRAADAAGQDDGAAAGRPPLRRLPGLAGGPRGGEQDVRQRRPLLPGPVPRPAGLGGAAAGSAAGGHPAAAAAAAELPDAARPPAAGL